MAEKLWGYSGISRIEEKERMLVGAAEPVIDGHCRELPQADAVELGPVAG